MTVVLVEGPDGVGKTEISHALADVLGVPYFKVPHEHTLWRTGRFRSSLPFDALLPSFVAQTGASFVSDRSFVSEAVYASVFSRETDRHLLEELDLTWARMGAVVLLLLRHSYDDVRRDELVEADVLPRLHAQYRCYVDHSAIRTVVMFVDGPMYACETARQVPDVVEAVGSVRQNPFSTQVVLYGGR